MQTLFFRLPYPSRFFHHTHNVNQNALKEAVRKTLLAGTDSGRTDAVALTPNILNLQIARDNQLEIIQLLDRLNYPELVEMEVRKRMNAFVLLCKEGDIGGPPGCQALIHRIREWVPFLDIRFKYTDSE